MGNFVFSLKWSVSDEGMIVMVLDETQHKAFNRLNSVYPDCPNIDYIGQVQDIIN